MYMHPFSYLLPLRLIIRHWIQLPELYTGILYTHHIYDTLHLLTPNSQSIPPWPPLGKHKSAFYVQYLTGFSQNTEGILYKDWNRWGNRDPERLRDLHEIRESCSNWLWATDGLLICRRVPVNTCGLRIIMKQSILSKVSWIYSTVTLARKQPSESLSHACSPAPSWALICLLL